MIHASNLQPVYRSHLSRLGPKDVWLGRIAQGEIYAVMGKGEEYWLTLFHGDRINQYCEVPLSVFDKPKPPQPGSWAHTAWVCYRIWEK